MSTRAAIRPRPLDINKQLLIVRELSELDSADGQQQGAENGAHGGDGHGPGHGHGAHQKKPKPIPIPDIREVETHYRDYLPLFSHPLTYLHGKGCGGNKELEPVEYDLDNEDEDWLAQYNIGRSRLSDTLFERMLWKLELECAAATDNALTAAGAGPSERSSAGAVAAIDHLPKQDAIRILMMDCGGREKLCWDVYNYWASKRKKWGKPILRRLQAPTLASDTNPYNTFRAREKTNRPQTRRRRDNSDELMDKLRQLRDNLAGAKQILEEVVRRERRKRDLACTEVELLRIQYRTRHEVGMTHDQISTEGLSALRDRMRINGQADQIRAGMRILANKTTLPSGVHLSKKPRTETVLKCLRPYVANMMHPPPAVEPEALWSMPANLLQIPVESKEKQRDRMDDIRRGRPSGFAKPGAETATTAAGATPAAAAAAGAAAGAAAAAAAGGAAAAGAAAGAAAATVAAAATAQQQQQQPAAGGLPPPGPSAGPSGGRMSAVVNSLNERAHLFKLPDGLSNNLSSWRCFIGRGGRARLERIDHVTHESLNHVKMEQQAVLQHYASEPWPPMPTAPMLRELVEKHRPAQPTRPGMHRSGSMGLASQGSAGSAMGPGTRRTSSANLGAAPQQATAAGAAGAGAVAAANGPPSLQQAQAGQQQQQGAAVQPQQQHVQAQQAHTAVPVQQQQPQQVQQGMQPGDQQQQQAAAAAAGAQQQQPAGVPADMLQQQQQPDAIPTQPQQLQVQDASTMAAAQQQQQQAAYMAAMQHQQAMGDTGMAYPGAMPQPAMSTGMAQASGSMTMGQYSNMPSQQQQQQPADMQAAMAPQQQQQQQGMHDAATMGMQYSGGDMNMGGYAGYGGMTSGSMSPASAAAAAKRTPAIKSGVPQQAGAAAAAAMPASARKGPGRPPKGTGQVNGMDV